MQKHLPTKKPEPTPPVLKLASLTGNSHAWRNRQWEWRVQYGTTNSPMEMAVCFVHACIYVKKETHAKKYFKITPFRKIVCKSTPKGKICRVQLKQPVNGED